MKLSKQPPEFRGSNKQSKHMILLIVLCVVLSGVCGFTGGYFASHSNSGVTINQVSSSKKSSKSSSGDISSVASKCGPSVVEIKTEAVSSGNSMFGQYVSEGAGSGVIISEDGYIVTNNHVISDASSITVTTTDGKSYEATLVGADSDSDLAVIKIDASSLTPATFGKSSELEVGDVAVAIGNPLGELGGTVTQGIISALDREIEVDGTTMTLLQTDASISPGNSGGGLFNSDGNLIGIVNAKYSSSSSSSSASVEGIGFAIPIDSATDVIDQLISNGSVTNRPALGVSLYDYSKSSNNSNYYMSDDSDKEDGVYIVQIVSGGAAEEAGLKEGDRIVSVNDTEVSSTSEVKAAIQKCKIGDKITVKVSRDGQEKEYKVTLQASTSSNSNSSSDNSK